jgi:uncharacterized protein
MRSLLDINVWIALLDDAHVFSERANSWLCDEVAAIATCPIVENGIIRIMSSPAYSREVSLIQMCSIFCASPSQYRRDNLI